MNGLLQEAIFTPETVEIIDLITVSWILEKPGKSKICGFSVQVGPGPDAEGRYYKPWRYHLLRLRRIWWSQECQGPSTFGAKDQKYYNKPVGLEY